MTLGFHEISLKEEGGARIVTLTFAGKGKLEKADYALFVPQLGMMFMTKAAISVCSLNRGPRIGSLRHPGRIPGPSMS